MVLQYTSTLLPGDLKIETRKSTSFFAHHKGEPYNNLFRIGWSKGHNGHGPVSTYISTYIFTQDNIIFIAVSIFNVNQKVNVLKLLFSD